MKPKSESKQLREAIYVLWLKRENDMTFEMYYKKVMGVLKGIVLKKIEADNKFMEEIIELAKDIN